MVCIRLLEIDDLVDIDKSQDIKAMSSVLNNTEEILNNENGIDDLDGAKIEVLEHVRSNLIIDIEDEIHLTDPVISYIKPTMGVQILFCIMISMVQFKTKIDLIAHTTLRYNICYDKRIRIANAFIVTYIIS